MANRIIHFEIPMDDIERATTFYRQMFGWDIAKWDGPMPYWNVKTGEGEDGINGAMLPRGGSVTSVVNTIGVDDIDATIENIIRSGGSQASPKMTIPGVGDFAYCKDTEGNTFGIIAMRRETG